MRRIKILFLITKGNWGGAQRYVYDLATALPSDFYEVAVIHGAGEELPQRLAKVGIRTIRIGMLGRDVSLLNDWRSFWSLVKIFRRDDPGVIHLNSPKMAGLGALAGRLTGVPKIVVTVHGWSWNEERPWLERAAIKFFSWLTIRLAHRVIVIAQTELAEAQQLPLVGRGKIKLIYNGVAELDCPAPAESRLALIRRAPALAVRQHGFWIGTIAELHRNKGLEDSLEAVAKLRHHLTPQPPPPRGGGEPIRSSSLPLGEGEGEVNLTWLIIGEGEDRARLAGRIKALDLEDRVFLLGNIPQGARWLKAFDLFVLPSVKEGLPYTLLEAGLAARTVIATRVGGVPEIIADGISGLLVPPRDPTALAEAVTRLQNDVPLRARLGERLRAIVRQKFSFVRMLSETRQIYEGW